MPRLGIVMIGGLLAYFMLTPHRRLTCWASQLPGGHGEQKPATPAAAAAVGRSAGLRWPAGAAGLVRCRPS